MFLLGNWERVSSQPWWKGTSLPLLLLVHIPWYININIINHKVTQTPLERSQGKRKGNLSLQPEHVLTSFWSLSISRWVEFYETSELHWGDSEKTEFRHPREFPGSPVFRTLFSRLSMWIQSLVGELRSHKLHGPKKISFKDFSTPEH